MGNFCSVSISCDAIFSRCVQCFITKASYISHLQDNLLLLQSELQKLIDVRDDVMTRVIFDERSLKMKRTGQVQGWLSRVQAAENQVAELQKLKDEETQKLCLGGYCSNNCKSSYDFGKRVHKMLQELTTLKTEGDFKNVAEKMPEDPVDEMPIDPTIIGLQSTFDKVWSCLGDQQAGIIGLYGMGGVGKTTLLTQINNKFRDTPNDFDVVIWVVVSKDQNLEMIQETISKKIGLWDDSWKTKRLKEKALDIFKVLSQKRFVLLLDDIWERVDLKELGVPLPSPKISSKIVFTTRSNEVCGHMGTHQHQFKVECLAPEEAWKLFQMNVGRETLDNDPRIPQVAKLVAKECDGLPLALITIGRAMACKKTVEEWNHAIQVLKESAFKFAGMDEEVYSLLKFSYDSLASDTLRSCLLYCSLFPEDYEIEKRDLIDFWIGEGFFDEYEAGYPIIFNILRACLLEEGDDDRLKMHDVIRDMALWIACEIEKEKGKFLVQTSVGLTEAPETEKLEGVKRMSLMENQIENLPETLSCPHLSTLFLNENCLKMINNDFFRFMPSLKVLNLSFTGLIEFPLGISRLVSLQHLDLSGTKIKELPEELKALANLRCLNLGSMYELNRVPRRLILSFAKLRIFRLPWCNWELGPVGDNVQSGGGEYLVEELLCLKYLKALSICLKGGCALRKFLKSQKLHSCTQFLQLEGFEESLDVVSLTGMKHLSELFILSYGLEELKIDYCQGEIRESHCFHSLRKVDICGCIKLRDATWLVFAPNLKVIVIMDCGDMEEVISVEKCGQVKDKIESLNPFAKLEYLMLHTIRSLKSIYWKPLPFPHLKQITALACPRLEKLPLDFNNAKERKIDFDLDPHLSEELKREDPPT
ncbi:hypothetical protein LWI29_034051 [Acer saccharum]|uniref:NB-ARC domain-containing protein n=1 Tax=Acer saccharum TaxID=4024 RepID=A0AA39SX44_ACESA|nr:hypothetical protein LWI29_034051 [Acer saccharum]